MSSGFKVLGNLTNVRPAKTETPELSTTPTSGNIKLNAPAAEKMKVAAGSYVSVAKVDEGDGGTNLYAFVGNETKKDEKGNVTENQVGSILAGKSGGSLGFSSENAWKELKGNTEKRMVYTLEDARVEGGVSYYKLTFAREEEKLKREAKA